MRSLLVGLIAAAGCRPLVSLQDVPILGAGPAEERVIRDELEDFDSSVGAGRLLLSKVVVREYDDGQMGAFRPGSSKVLLAAGLPEVALRTVVRHELCHALDLAEDLLAERTRPFDELADSLFSPGQPLFVQPDLDDALDPRQARAEAMALYCEKGAAAASLLAEPCPNDPPIVVDAGTWLLDTVWTGEPRIWEMGRAFGEPVRFGTSLTVESLDVVGTVAGNVVEMDIGPTDIQVDVWTGHQVSDPLALDETYPPSLAAEVPGVEIAGVAAWPDGPGAARGWVDLWDRGVTQARAFAWDGNQWSRVPEICMTSLNDVFVADGAAWFATGETHTVLWEAFVEL